MGGDGGNGWKLKEFSTVSTVSALGGSLKGAPSYQPRKKASKASKTIPKQRKRKHRNRHGNRQRKQTTETDTETKSN